MDSERREARAQLLKDYVEAIPATVETALALRRPAHVPTSQERRDRFEGVMFSAESIGPEPLSERAAELGASAELQAAIDAAEIFIHVQPRGDPAAIAPAAAALSRPQRTQIRGRQRARLTSSPSSSTWDSRATHFLMARSKSLRRTFCKPQRCPPIRPTIRKLTMRAGGDPPSAIIAAARSLPRIYGRTGNAAAADALTGLTAHPRANVRRFALIGIVHLGTERRDQIWELLEVALDDRNSGVVHTAAEMISRLSKR